MSLGADHAVNLALMRADLFPLAIGLSGNYDPAAWDAWGERGEPAYFNNPLDSLAHMGGGHLEWLRGRFSVLLVCGHWGHDVPHHWPSWRAQPAHHLPRFC